MLFSDHQRRPQNHILSALAPETWTQVKASAQHVALVFKQVLFEEGNPVDEVFFVESGLVSQIADTGDEAGVEVAMIGREGFVGRLLLLNAEARAPNTTVVQCAGTAWRMRSGPFLDAVARSEVFRDLCMRDLQAAIVQTAQAGACNARHDVSARLARWLLMASDRIQDDEIPMRHEFLSALLGVRRAGVSVVVRQLSDRGLIEHSRGRIQVCDRPGLQQAACSCYGRIRSHERSIKGDLAVARRGAVTELVHDCS